MKKRLQMTALLAVMATQTMLLNAHAIDVAENRVAVVIDASGSFKSKLQDAIASAASLLEKMGTVSIKRWEPAKDRIILISMDALPEVIWSGSLQELRTLDQKYWKSAFELREEYGQCTDVIKGFRLAISELNRDAGAKINKYMFIYSDLVHEPPTDSIGECAPIDAANPVPSDMPWEAIADISIVTLWIPIENKFSWAKAVEEHGLTETFHLFARESEVKEILPPPRPDNRPTKEEEQEAKEKVFKGASFAGQALLIIGMLILMFIIITLLFVLGLFIWARFIRKPRQTPPAHLRRPRPVQRRPVNFGNPGPPRS